MYCPHLLARLSLIVSTCLIKDVALPGGRRVAVVVKGEKDADIGRVLGDYGVSPF